MVKVLGEVRELASLLHDGFFHEEGGLDLSVVTLSQLGHTVGDEGLVKLHAQAFQVVAAMTSDARSTFHLEHVKASHDLVMTKLSKLASISLEAAVGFAPSAHNFVICLILGNGDVRVDDVANLSKQLLGLRCDFLCLLFLLLDRGIESLGLGLLGRNVSFLVSLLLGSGSLGDNTFISLHAVKSVLS